jgi:hypothetical protein
MKKVVSFSLWGSDPKYCAGAIKNAQLASSVYPDWETWFYCGSSVPQATIDNLKLLGSKIIEKEDSGNWTSTFWRFEPIADAEVEVMISRDTDSRLSLREKEAVKCWLESSYLFHVMRDHPAHTVPILAGMWGAKKPILGDMVHLMNAYTKQDTKQSDQIFLQEVIWPRVSYTTMTHDEFFAKMKFPTQREPGDFVGQVYDENDIPNEVFKQSLIKATK